MLFNCPSIKTLTIRKLLIIQKTALFSNNKGRFYEFVLMEYYVKEYLNLNLYSY